MNSINTIHAEEAILGSILHDNAALEDVIGVLRKDDFSSKFHQDVFIVLNELISKGVHADIVCVSSELRNKYGEANDQSFVSLCHIANSHYCRVNIKAYADILREGSFNRSLITYANDILEGVKSGRKNIIDSAQKQFNHLIDNRSQGIAKISDYLGEVLEDIESRRNNNSYVTGISTGFHELDKMTGGLHPRDLIILGGRPAMGKTVLAMNIAEHVSLVDKATVAIFSMEMSKKQLAERSLISVGKINASSVKAGTLDGAQMSKLADSVARLHDAKIFIDDRASMDISEIRAVCRRIKRDHGLGLVVVDYLTLMAGDGDNETARIGNISRGLKILACDLEVAVIAVSQVNRSLESRNDKRPVMSDLRQSGSIEQDADLVLFIYRDEIYNKESRQRGIAEIIIAKHRHGSLGTVYLAFNGGSYCFSNVQFEPQREYSQPRSSPRRQYTYYPDH